MNELKNLSAYSITISVSDIEKMTAWYINNLGFKRLANEAVTIFKSKIQFVELNGFCIELIEQTNSEKKESLAPPRHTSTQGITNLCLQTTNLDAIKELLKQKNISPIWESESEELKMKMFFIEDPDKNLIQFLQKI